MTPAEELAAAADKLDALAAAASPAPWVDAGDGKHNLVASLSGQLSATIQVFDEEGNENPVKQSDTAAYIAAMNPLVGKALAEMLRRFEYACLDPANQDLERWRSPETQRVEKRIPGLLAALDLARLINGSTS